MANRAYGGVTQYQLRYGPDPKQEYTLSFEVLSGGLNIQDLDYQLRANESPDMLNLNWRDGVLSSRMGQDWLSLAADKGVGYTCAPEPFWGNAFFHIGSKLYRMDLDSEEHELIEIRSGVPEIRGTFFRYMSWLMYKTKGAYIKIEYDERADQFTVSDVAAYTPIIQINTDPETHAGDMYQHENRLSAQKEIWYNAKSGVKKYQLPVTGATVDKVYVDDVETTAYSVTETAVGTTVEFDTAPPVTEPPTNNTVRIIYSKSNTDAYNSVMDCRYAAVYGGNLDMCVVLGGCPAQPNAYFWSGSNISADPGYFPMPYYNFAGDVGEPITGFGKQQSMLVIFKERSVGRALYGITEIDKLAHITMDYTPINSRIGCDLPWTIQLVENNLVFCNRRQGVHLLKDSSAAYENNIVCISRKVNGDNGKVGIVDEVREAEVDRVCAVDIDSKYFLTVGKHTYEWDYTISGYSNPTWFRHDNISAMAYFQDITTLGYVNALGQVIKRVDGYSDCGVENGVEVALPINKRYVFPTMFFSTYDRMKNVNTVIVTMRSDTDTTAHLRYSCDWIDRDDPTPLETKSWHLSPRNLAFRYLTPKRFAVAFKRKPGLKHIKHFTMELSNNAIGEDLSLVSAQVFYNYQGRSR